MIQPILLRRISSVLVSCNKLEDGAVKNMRDDRAES